ncbi:glutathione S-transferase-like protein [Dendrothele bispora CBS 962.96]|uniref:glutathione transferase n=1 Tax=Dendrothele bispora (strain CBS 962.96) TaxID=1314807 RepID=A0A4S8MMX3_DENBC|nr:glutathione S-transferase-like protein [Dendrothele bispora CBS 962.96]
MTLIIYGFRKSTCTRRVALICKELNVPYEVVDVNLAAGEQRSEAHLARQPFGVVPAISDNGFELFESRAICRYLVQKYGKPGPDSLMPDPKDVEATAKFEQAASIENNNFDVFAGQIALESVVKPMRGGTTDTEVVKKNTAILEAKLDVYDRILSKQKYLAGDVLTIADLFHLPFGMVITEGAKYDGLLKRPNVARWWKDISSRPAWQAVKDGA